MIYHWKEFFSTFFSTIRSTKIERNCLLDCLISPNSNIPHTISFSQQLNLFTHKTRTPSSKTDHGTSPKTATTNQNVDPQSTDRFRQRPKKSNSTIFQNIRRPPRLAHIPSRNSKLLPRCPKKISNHSSSRRLSKKKKSKSFVSAVSHRDAVADWAGRSVL